MKVSFNMQNPYIPRYGQGSGTGAAGHADSGISGGAGMRPLNAPGAAQAGAFWTPSKKESGNSNRSAEIRELLRKLKSEQDKNNPYEASSENGFMSDMWTSSVKDDKDEKKLPEVNRYNSKELANKIRSAKTSASASRAVIAAKRKVSEIKRKLSSGSGDAEELQAQLTHARRMEIVAKRKKHHLELEELVSRTMASDERKDRQEESLDSIRNGVLDGARLKLEEQEDKIYEERSRMMEESMEELRESTEEVSEEAMDELNETISEFGEEAVKEIEEMMEALDQMEIVDPHMDEEDFRELKTKHRNSEEKALLKAELDYLKDTLKHSQPSAGSMGGAVSSGMQAAFSGMAGAGMGGTDFSGAAGVSSVDVQV